MHKYLEKAHSIDPDNATIALQYSNLLLKLGHNKENISLIEPFLADHDIDPQMEWNIACSYQKEEQFDKAQKAYEAALPTYQDNSDFLKELIRFYQEIGEHDLMMDQLEHYLRLVPTDSEMADLYDSYE